MNSQPVTIRKITIAKMSSGINKIIGKAGEVANVEEENIDVDADLYVDDNLKMSVEKCLKEDGLSIDEKSDCDDDR